MEHVKKKKNRFSFLNIKGTFKDRNVQLFYSIYLFIYLWSALDWWSVVRSDMQDNCQGYMHKPRECVIYVLGPHIKWVEGI